jgi:hypothetical protein
MVPGSGLGVGADLGIGVGRGPGEVEGVTEGITGSGIWEGEGFSRPDSFIASVASRRAGGLGVPIGGKGEEGAPGNPPSLFKSLAPVGGACALVTMAGLLSVLTSTLFFGIFGS